MTEPTVWVPSALLALVSLGLAVAVVRLRARVGALESAAGGVETGAGAPSSTSGHSLVEEVAQQPSRNPDPAPYVITVVGEPALARRIDGSLFADLVLRESVVKGVSLVHGLRQALAPETRNRIRFQMRQEVKRARKLRRADARAGRRLLADQQRATLDEDAA